MDNRSWYVAQKLITEIVQEAMENGKLAKIAEHRKKMQSMGNKVKKVKEMYSKETKIIDKFWYIMDIDDHFYDCNALRLGVEENFDKMRKVKYAYNAEILKLLARNDDTDWVAEQQAVLNAIKDGIKSGHALFNFIVIDCHDKIHQRYVDAFEQEKAWKLSGNGGRAPMSNEQFVRWLADENLFGGDA